MLIYEANVKALFQLTTAVDICCTFQCYMYYSKKIAIKIVNMFQRVQAEETLKSSKVPLNPLLLN